MSTDENKPAATPGAQSSGPQGLLMGGVVIVLLAIGAVIWLIVSGGGANPANNTAEAATNGAAPASAMPDRGRLLPSGLRFEEIRAGTGAQITPAVTPLVRYELRVAGREQILESNFDQPQPAPLPLDGVIPGFAEALTLMRVGGEARFWVPPNLGYGENVRPGSPFGPNDVLEFRVRVDGVAPAAAPAASAPTANSLDELPPEIRAAIEEQLRNGAQAQGQR